jgi:hypothetical protein
MEEPKKQDQTLNIFKSINGFVKNMNECYGSQQKTLQLYARLITKTTFEDEGPISRHVAAFTKFCQENKDSILEKNHKTLVNPKISYNEKVYINMQHILNSASASERSIIWKHILTIYAFIDPQSQAKEMLRQVIDKDGKGGKEEEFLTDIFDKVGNNIQPDGNPLQAVGNLMSSGIFTDIVGSMSNGLENGELDLGRLMGSMQGMVTNIGSMADQNGQTQQPEMAEMLGQMTAMMGNLNKMSQQTDATVSQEDLARGSELANQMISQHRPSAKASGSATEAGVEEVGGSATEVGVEEVGGSVTEAGSKFEIIDDGVHVGSETVNSIEKPKEKPRKRKGRKKAKDEEAVLVLESPDVD